jgi:predicted CoA-binding protein
MRNMTILDQDEAVRRILGFTRRVAIVGLSDDPSRPSHSVARRLIRLGYEVVPVNPTLSEVLEMSSFPRLSDVPGEIDLVDVFRREVYLPGVAHEAVDANAKALWMQQGLVSEEARHTAESAGLVVVEDLCLAVEAERLSREMKLPPESS